MTAASPGIVALTLGNRYYDSHEDYVFALAEELRKEYETIVAHGLTLQLDCPDLAMERHVSYQDEPLSAFQDLVDPHIRAINHTLTNIPRAGFVCTSAGATARARTITMCRWRTSSTSSMGPTSERW